VTMWATCGSTSHIERATLLLMARPTDTVLDPATAGEYLQDQEPGAALKGSSGKPLWAGRPVGWEPNRKFADGVWFCEIVPRLELNGSVDIGYRAKMDLILTAKVKPSRGRRVHKGCAEFLRQQWGLEGRRPRLIRDTWENSLRQGAKAIFTGAAVFEWVTRVVYERGVRRVFLNKLHPRHMSTVVAWLTDEDEQLVGIRQLYYGPRGGARAVDIPVSQLLVISYRMRGATDFDGVGIWRPMADDVADHKDAAGTMRIGGRKFAVGEIDIEIDPMLGRQAGVIPASATPQDVNNWLATERAAAKEYLRKRQVSEESGIIRPPWWKVGVTGGGAGYDPAKVVQQRNHFGEQILRGHSAQYLLVAASEGAGGGYNAADAHMAAGATAAQNDLDFVLGAFDTQVNDPLLRMNFPEVDPDEFPRLEASGLRAPVYVQNANVLAQLQQAGLLKPSQGDNGRIRDDMELEPEDASDASAPSSPPSTATPSTVPPAAPEQQGAAA